MDKTICIKVKGKVQGVYYRQSTREKADLLGIKGQVSNLPDHSVEIIASGTETALSELIEWCRSGPPAAIVTQLDIQELPFKQFSQFLVNRHR